MTILEELWYGNITPTEYSRIENNDNYKEALRLVNQNQERLKATLTDEQNELLERLLTASEEFSNLCIQNKNKLILFLLINTFETLLIKYIHIIFKV